MFYILKKIFFFCRNNTKESYEDEVLKRQQFNSVLLNSINTDLSKYNYLNDNRLTYKQKLKLYSNETEEERVIRILKCDFEKCHGISFNKFMNLYNNIVTNNPEKLI